MKYNQKNCTTPVSVQAIGLKSGLVKVKLMTEIGSITQIEPIWMIIKPQWAGP
jgi:hypothetical protein